MSVLHHHYSFTGHMSQSSWPDLFLTTPEGGPGGEVIPAHRVIMFAVSSKLAVLCKEGGKVVIRNISFNVLEQVVMFIYSGRIELVNEEDIENLKDGLDMLRVNIAVLEDNVVGPTLDDQSLEESRNNNPDEASKHKNQVDNGGNLIVKNIFSLSGEDLKIYERVWPEKVQVDKVENIKIVERNQYTSVSVPSLHILEGSKDESSTNITQVKQSLPSVTAEKASGGAKSPLPNIKNSEMIRRSEIQCEYCEEKLMYREYLKHCKIKHPGCPWTTKRKCGSCKVNVPDVSYQHHIDLFGHKERTEDLVDKQDHVVDEMPSKISKSQTKVPCDYCEDYVTLATYVGHCKKLHSVVDDGERCRRKCYKCGAKVHIISQKFHDQIYHSAHLKQVSRKSEPLVIVEHNKSLTKVPCKFCSDNVKFGSYKEHVKNKHPEVAYAELVKCSKCGCKVSKISFQFHRQIFHKSTKFNLKPVANSLISKPKFKLPVGGTALPDSVHSDVDDLHVPMLSTGSSNTSVETMILEEDSD